mmetsp:Transcript_21652/g.38016  ORF Transcript_21652/g.38016 Transcript_21652/m.38016 type:complete len:85 (+) Transcript_21652:228-482(+)
MARQWLPDLMALSKATMPWRVRPGIHPSVALLDLDLELGLTLGLTLTYSTRDLRAPCLTIQDFDTDWTVSLFLRAHQWALEHVN